MNHRKFVSNSLAAAGSMALPGEILASASPQQVLAGSSADFTGARFLQIKVECCDAIVLLSADDNLPAKLKEVQK